MRAAVPPIIAAVVVVACGTSGTALPAREAVGWALGSAIAANGPAPEVDIVEACGSATATYLSELLDNSALAAKVQYQWGDCVPGGKQIMVSGVVTKTHLGPTDLPISHPFGDDLSMNVELDLPFIPYARKLGSEQSEQSATQMHVEIASGLIPHLPRPRAADGLSYREIADRNLERAYFQPGFAEPAVGDRVLAMGRYIIDCGHGDFSPELHAMSFLSWSHVEGKTTTVRFYYNPYRDSGVYGEPGAPLGRVGDAARLEEGTPFPRYLVGQVIGLADKVDRLRALEYMDATTVSPEAWEICPPSPSAQVQVRYDVVTRSGVALDFAPDAARGCVAVHASLDAYRPADAAMRTCPLPWSYLDEIVQGEVGQPLDLHALLQSYLPSPQAKARADADPETSCADALAGPPVDPAPKGRSVRVDDAQPFPFYGVVTVATP
jgi:hypothetical protein